MTGFLVVATPTYWLSEWAGVGGLSEGRVALRSACSDPPCSGPGGPREATPPPPPADAPLGVLGQQPHGDGLHLGVLLQAALPPAENEGCR